MRVSIPYRAPILIWVLFCLELPITVALLALFGIANPNLYRTKLWQDGADNGFNSNPNEIIYAYANYRPISTPRVWSQFITSYNVIITVLSVFVALCKVVGYIVRCFPPILSLFAHALMIALFAVSVDYQTASDLSDKQHPQHGAPWYITKSCSVTKHQSNIGYCKQAKAAFACTIIMLAIFSFQFILALVSMIWSRKSFDDDDELPTSPDESALKELRLPRTPGTTGGMKSPQTPRTLAFNKLGGTKDLPLRNHFSSPTPKSPTYQSVPGSSQQDPMYFPPPPKAPMK